MDIDALQATYDRIARDYYEDHKNDPWNNEFTELFSKSLFSGARVLDLGCGPGIETKKLVEKGFAVQGFDLSPELLKIAQEKVPEAQFRQGNIRETLPYDADSFDGIFCKATLLHVPHREIEKVLGEIKRILKKDGILYVSVKKGEGEQMIEENDYGYTYERFFSFWGSEELEKLFEKFSFSVIKKSIDSHQHYNQYFWLKFLLRNEK